jgi:Tol biopolymer transport system component
MHGQLKWIVAPTVFVIGVALSAGQSQQTSQFELVPKIVFSSNSSSNRQNSRCNVFDTALELFLMNPDGTNVQRWTDSEECTHSDFFAALSPDGKKIVFDSTRVAANISPLVPRLFLMDSDGTELTFLTPGSGATWSSDSKYVAFQASASYYASNGLNEYPDLIRPQPGAPTIDADIFVANVDDVVAGAAIPKNITNSDQMIDEDPDWSSDGTKIVFTSDPPWDSDPMPPDNRFNYPYKEIFMMNTDGRELRQGVRDAQHPSFWFRRHLCSARHSVLRPKSDLA